MKLIEAIKSGKPFRNRRISDRWVTAAEGHYIPLNTVLDEYWEIQSFVTILITDIEDILISELPIGPMRNRILTQIFGKATCNDSN